MKFITEALSLSIMLQMALGASPVVPRSALASHNFNAIKNSNLAGRRLYGLRNRYQKGSLEFTDANGIVHNAKLLKIKDDYFAKVDNGKGKNVYTRLAEGKDGKIEFDTSKTISARRRALMKHSTKLAAGGAGLAMFGVVAAIGGSSRDADEEKFKQEMEDYKKYQLQMAQISGAELEKFAADPTDKSINMKTNPGGNAEVDNNALHLPNLDLDMDIESLTDLNHTPSSTHTTSGMATNNIADVSGNLASIPMGMGPNVGSQSSGMGSHIASQSSMPNMAPLNSGAPGIPSINKMQLQSVDCQLEEAGSTEINFKIQSVRDRINAAKDELKTLFEVADKFQTQIEEAKREVQELEKKKDIINKETAFLQQESNEWEKKRENLDQEWQKLMNEKVHLDELLK